jgi:deoxyribonuclease-1
MKRLLILSGFIAIVCLTGNVLAEDDWYAVTLSDSVVSFGAVTTGETDSLLITLTNNLTIPVQIIGASFDENVFWATTTDLPVPAQSSSDIVICFDSGQNVSYTDFLRIELDEGVRPLVAEVSAEAHYSDTYYASTQNKWAEELKDSLTAIIDDHNSVGYTTARDSMYGHIDNDAGWVECVYTGRRAYFNTRAGATANNFNCEHTWPQSFSGESEPMKSDIFHLYPSDMTANGMRANLDFGIVTSASWSVGGSKLGTDSEGQTVFEPRDVHKGNVARSHFYYIIRYDGNYNLYQNPFKMEAHFRNWHTTDPVDSAEQQRNEDIRDLQYNRNPFIDHPELVDRISSFFGTATVETAPEIAVSPQEGDLGMIGFNTEVHYYVAVVNTGNDTLHVSSITSTNPDFDINKAGLQLASESYEYVGITYTSADQEVIDSTSILILSDDNDESLVTVPITVQVCDLAAIDQAETVSSEFRLYQNRPNPFGSRTTISFALDRSVEVSLAVYDVKGQLISNILHKNQMSSGKYRVHLSGNGMSPGVYFYRLAAGGRVLTKRMIHTHSF